MNGLARRFGVNLRLYFRNKMGMFYGYLFPAIFLLAFWVLYRSEPIPLARHIGQLLTVTILGGACLGMPTTMVSERERGVWRRYRLTPASTRGLIASTVVLRYFIVITAGLLQLALAMSIGMPLPLHPLQLALAFTVVAFAFLGLGLVMAAMADNVPSVQALGQCIFLPMLIVGGVAVPLASLPNWALHVSAFFPGRYAVETLQSCITGNGTQVFSFDLLALLLIGVAGFAGGGWMFRWDAQQRFAARGKGWLALVIGAWAVVGLAAELRGRIDVESSAAGSAQTAPALTSSTPPSWQAVTLDEINRNADFYALPPDNGIISPIARPGVEAPPEILEQLDMVTVGLLEWLPGKVDDPVQRVRNLLYVAAVPDVLEAEILESYVPLVVFERLREVIPKNDLIRILYWIATHPSGGDDQAVHQLQPLGLGNARVDIEVVRERVTIYSLKLLGRLIGKFPSK